MRQMNMKQMQERLWQTQEQAQRSQQVQPARQNERVDMPLEAATTYQQYSILPDKLMFVSGGRYAAPTFHLPPWPPIYCACMACICCACAAGRRENSRRVHLTCARALEASPVPAEVWSIEPARFCLARAHVTTQGPHPARVARDNLHGPQKAACLHLQKLHRGRHLLLGLVADRLGLFGLGLDRLRGECHRDGTRGVDCYGQRKRRCLTLLLPLPAAATA